MPRIHSYLKKPTFSWYEIIIITMVIGPLLDTFVF
jgi:hypothetical protein